MQMALGDALAVALMEHRRFTPEHFRTFHPGGKLGARLATVADLMHAEMPLVAEATPMTEALLTISRTGFGVTGGLGICSGCAPAPRSDTIILAAMEAPDPTETDADLEVVSRPGSGKGGYGVSLGHYKSRSEAEQRLLAHPLPGNVRQLENICHWLSVMAPSQVVEPKDLPDELQPGYVPAPSTTAMTGTPRVSSASSVFGISRIALAPAETTVTGVRANSSRSAEMSKLVSAPWCTPPMPPVAKTAIPAPWAAIMVAATVVPPVSPSAQAKARSARDSLSVPLAFANVSASVADRPMRIVPSMTAMVAGVAP